MGRPKGLAKTGGRQTGGRNKKTVGRENERLQSGLDPLDFLIEVFRDERQDIDRRIEAAKAAAPYKHSRLTAIALSGELNVISHEQALTQLK